MENNKTTERREKMERRIVLCEFECERCGHKWLPRSEERPRTCPKCKSAWWDTPRKQKIENAN